MEFILLRFEELILMENIYAFISNALWIICSEYDISIRFFEYVEENTLGYKHLNLRITGPNPVILPKTTQNMDLANWYFLEKPTLMQL